jgi:TolA-binding protein
MNSETHTTNTTKSCCPFRDAAFPMLSAFLSLLCFTGCASWMQGKGASSHSTAKSDTELLSRLEKQQIVLNDLSERITELENVLIRQEYDLTKLKKIVKHQATQPISLTSSTEAQIEVDGEEDEDFYDDSGSSYSIFMQLSPTEETGHGGSANPMLKLQGPSSGSSPDSASGKSEDLASLMKEASLASGFVPLKLGTVPMASDVEGEPGEADEGVGEGKGVTGGEPLKAASVDPYDAGVEKYKTGKWKDATLYFDIFLKQSPESLKAPNALFLKAECLFQAGKTLEALGAFEKIEMKYPNFSRVPEAKFRIGRCYEKMSDKSKALKIYESIIQDYPKSTVAMKALNRIKGLKKN